MLANLRKLLDSLLNSLPNPEPSLSKNSPHDSTSSNNSSPQLNKDKPVAISIEAYFQDSKTGDDRRVKYSKDYTNEILENAKDLLKKVNSFLEELGVMSARVSSGWRPPSVNASIPGSAKRSLHMDGKAIDIVDTSGDLDRMIIKKEQELADRGQPSLLRKYGLWLEDPEATKTWCHLDCSSKRTDRPLRVFKP